MTRLSGASAVMAKPSGTTRTVIVDDHPLFRDGFRELLESEPGIEVCGEAEQENAAFQLIQDVLPDLVTVDVSLASGNGLNLVSRIKQKNPTTIVLVLSMYDERVYAERALAAGASGYVCKQATNDEIIHAVRTVRGGEIYLRPDVLQQFLKKKTSAGAFPANSEEAVLSDRELEILSLLGQGKTTQQISTELHLAISTVETYRDRLKTKLNLASGAELTRYAILWMISRT